MLYDFMSYILVFFDSDLPVFGETMGLSAYGSGTQYGARFFTVTSNNIHFNFDVLWAFYMTMA